jgi:hypothetical protein
LARRASARRSGQWPARSHNDHHLVRSCSLEAVLFAAQSRRRGRRRQRTSTLLVQRSPTPSSRPARVDAVASQRSGAHSPGASGSMLRHRPDSSAASPCFSRLIQVLRQNIAEVGIAHGGIAATYIVLVALCTLLTRFRSRRCCRSPRQVVTPNSQCTRATSRASISRSTASWLADSVRL